MGNTSTQSKGFRDDNSEERDNEREFGATDNFDDKSSLNVTRGQMSDSKVRKRAFLQKPMIMDMADMQSEKSTMAPVQEQIDTLNAIKAYNKALKPARRAKDSLPEIPSTNIAKLDRYVKDHKKKKLNVERSYQAIGILDGGISTSLNGDKYSLAAN